MISEGNYQSKIHQTLTLTLTLTNRNISSLRVNKNSKFVANYMGVNG